MTVANFESVFDGAPTGQASAPGRVNLIGEHIDYNGGTVLPMAISLGVQVALAPNASGRNRIASDRFSGLIERDIDETPSDHWSDYIQGGLAAARDAGHLPGGVDLTVSSDLPDGAGLSSSAAIITAVLRAALHHDGASEAPATTAGRARSVEVDYLGMPCGIMDQMAVGIAAPGEALALNTATGTWRALRVPRDWAFLVVHSGIHRKLSDGRYRERFEACEAARRALDLEHLCLAGANWREQIAALNKPTQRVARHVITEHQRTLSAIAALEAGDCVGFGELMNASHTSYSEDFAASTPEIDALVKTAQLAGAKGARLTGGGFGGCVVCLCDPDSAQATLNAIGEAHPAAWPVWQSVTA